MTWEFPILAKYRLTLGTVRPSLEVGPAFRRTGNLNMVPSHYGFSGGGGLEVQLHQINIAPTIRYTRWAEDSTPSAAVHSRPDQLELLVDLTRSSSETHPFGKHVSVGAVFGVNLVGDYSPQTQTFTGEELNGPVAEGFSSTSGSRSFLAGPSVEVSLFKSLSVEGNAIYRPIRMSYTNSSPLNGAIVTSSGEDSLAS